MWCCVCGRGTQSDGYVKRRRIELGFSLCLRNSLSLRSRMAKGTLFLTAMAVVLVLAHAEIKLQSVERKINLNSQFARITEIIKAKNTGSRAEDRVTLCQLQQGKSVIAYQKVSQQLSSKTKLKFSPTTIKDAPDLAVCWSVQLKEPIPAGEVATLDSLVVLANAQTAYPAEVAQGEPQLMLFHDNVHVISPYHVSTQTTEVVLPSSTVKSYTDTEKPVSKNENRIKYGKYDLIKPWSISPLRLHFDNPKPFRKVLSLTREIEVSHWGNIYVEEQYELKNDGAKHKGAFSRLRHAHSYGGQGNSFQELKARVPSSAHSLYYVDIIGNISTSAVRKTNTETVIDFMTRYPLLGGWKVDFKLGYSVPLQGFLSAIKGGKRRLSIDFSSPVEGVYIEDLTVKIVLPEGSSAIAASLPYEVEQWADVKFTYLDVTGRPVVVLHKKHLVPEHSAKVTVDYSFATLEILREPLMLITAFAALFAAAIVYNRLELTISRDDKWQAAQDIEKLTTIMQAINTIVDEQDEVLESLSNLTASVTSPDAVDDAIKEKNNQEATFTSLENKAKSLSSTVTSMQPKVGEKVKDVIDKARGTQQRLVKIFNDRCDLIKKGTSISEVVKRVPSGAEARQELATVVETLFAPY